MNNERIILADKQTSILLFTVIDIVITYEEDGNIVSLIWRIILYLKIFIDRSKRVQMCSDKYRVGKSF